MSSIPSMPAIHQPQFGKLAILEDGVSLPRRRRRYGALKSLFLFSLALVAAAKLAPVLVRRILTYMTSTYNETLRYVEENGLAPSGVITAARLRELRTGSQSIDVGGNRRLRLFMYVGSPNINLCRSIMSAVALGYPAPILLNWGGEFSYSGPSRAQHGTNLHGFLSVIEDLLSLAEGEDSDVNEDDLAVLVDAQDVWFQLPPAILIERFHDINREADEMVKRQWRASNDFTPKFPVSPPSQSTIITTRDRQLSKVKCSVLGTAQGPEPAYTKCTDDGMIMGTMSALRDILQRCKSKIRGNTLRGAHVWFDHSILYDVIAEQEAWRYWMRDLSGKWNGTTSKLDKFAMYGSSVVKAAMRGDRLEFGIGLDHNLTTIAPAYSAQDVGSFVKINEKEILPVEPQTNPEPGLTHVRVGRPLLPPARRVGPDHLSSVKWRDIRLFTDFYSGVTPVGIHHVCDSDCKTRNLQSWWNMTWFHPYLRSFVGYSLLPLEKAKPIQPLARIPLQGHTVGEVVYWAPKTDLMNRRVKVFVPSTVYSSGGSYIPIEWDGVCQSGNTPWFDEVFGDGKGPLN